MSPQLTIITAAMSLGGMASVGFNHHKEVENQVAEFQEGQQVEAQQVELADVGERMEEVLVDVEENLQIRLQENQDNFLEQLAGVQAQMQLLQSKQSSQDVLMESLAKDYTALEFRTETLADSFRPLPSIGGRFMPVKSQSEAHSLLPPLAEESSWTNDY
ncbi:MAG: hypothetical protein ACSHYB_13395 [Roseibacillus sp.]